MEEREAVRAVEEGQVSAEQDPGVQAQAERERAEQGRAAVVRARGSGSAL
jgi:hypothetical protein